jgi:hypothetical protein
LCRCRAAAVEDHDLAGLTDADAGTFDVTVGTWLMSLAGFAAPAAAGRDAGEKDCPPELMQMRLDGKAIRSAKDADGN